MNLAHKYSYEKVFIAAMLILFSFFAVGFVKDFAGDQANVFFAKTGDYMADYYNVAKYCSEKNIYHFGETDPLSHEHAYPPLTYMIFYYLSKCANYLNLGAFEAGRGTTIGLAVSSFFMFFISALFYVILYDAYNGKKTYKFLCSTILLLSSVFIFSFERGNTILLAAACLFFFILNYKSDSKVIKELSFVVLAVAAALKAYPAIFGILLLFEKRYKEAIRLAIYGLLFTFLPFLFFKGGFGNIPIWLNNLSANSNAYNYGVFPRFNFRFFASRISDPALKETVYRIFPKIDFLLCGAATLLSFFHNKTWKKILQLLLVIVILPVNSAEYCGLYLFLAIILFFNEEQKTKFDWLYLALFVLVLNPYQIIYRGGIQEWNITAVLMNLSASLMLILLMTESLLMAVKFTRSKAKRFS